MAPQSVPDKPRTLPWLFLDSVDKFGPRPLIWKNTLDSPTWPPAMPTWPPW